MVAPTSVTSPSSTAGSSASCCALLKRWISSRNMIVGSPLVARRWPARSITSRTSWRARVHRRELLERRAGVHRHQPGQRGLAGARGARRGPSSAGGPPRCALRSAEPSSSRCPWPTNSSSEAGRIRAASGWSVGGTRVWPRGAVVLLEEPLHQSLSRKPPARPRSAPGASSHTKWPAPSITTSSRPGDLALEPVRRRRPARTGRPRPRAAASARPSPPSLPSYGAIFSKSPER